MDSDHANVTVEGYEYLKYSHLKLLAPQVWLNDEVITEYINLINLKLKEQESSYVVFNSLKTKSIFEKGDFVKIKKIL
jgi:Ulp1 family protease